MDRLGFLGSFRIDYLKGIVTIFWLEVVRGLKVFVCSWLSCCWI